MHQLTETHVILHFTDVETEALRGVVAQGQTIVSSRI